MARNIDSITTQGEYGVTITLKTPNSEFLDYLASAYGPRMISPTGLQSTRAGPRAELPPHPRPRHRSVHADRGQVGSHYRWKAFPDYWGPKPYFENVNLPVITDSGAAVAVQQRPACRDPA